MRFTINGNEYTLTPEDMILSTEDLPGWKVASDGRLTVALDVMMSDDLLAEGVARDLVSVIQKIRKDKDFQVQVIHRHCAQFLQIPGKTAIAFHQHGAFATACQGCTNRPTQAITHGCQTFIADHELAFLLLKGLIADRKSPAAAAWNENVIFLADFRKL